jgi:hypothetical protein
MSYAQIRSTVIGAALAISLLTVAGTFAEQAAAQNNGGPVLNPRHPDTYVVQPGDTLWDIAAMFLRDPWYWPEIWQINPQIENPHLIYPGDILSLAYLDNGSPVVQLTRGPAGTSGVVRLSPTIRTEPIEEAIPTIPYETLSAFLSRPAVLDPDELDGLPYIFAHPDGLLGSAGRDVYVRGNDEPEGTIFSVVHRGEALIDPDDGVLLGYQGIYVGRGRIERTGDPSTVYLTETAREAATGDYLMHETTVRPANFFPRAPESAVEGRIISVVDGVSVIGQFQVVVINRGARDGLAPGHVLSVYKTGAYVSDPTLDSRFSDEKVRLPDEMEGTTMVFRTFDRISYALVMEATRELRVLDTVRNPES